MRLNFVELVGSVFRAMLNSFPRDNTGKAANIELLQLKPGKFRTISLPGQAAQEARLAGKGGVEHAHFLGGMKGSRNFRAGVRPLRAGS